MKKLLIVESPNKIKKLKAILGDDYEVAASVGHIRDLPLKELGVDRTNGFELHYEINPDKKDVVSKLKVRAKYVGIENVLLATDPDREGEAISYHLCKVLDIPLPKARRVTFQEITEKAVMKAIERPRPLELFLVRAQEARRAIDRLAGYEVSDVLNTKIEREKGVRLSAGRVQSVTVRLVVDREREIAAFSSVSSFRVTGDFVTDSKDVITATRQGNFSSEADARAYLESCKVKTFVVENVETKEVEKQPKPSFTTSTLQQDAIKKFKWSAKQVMDVAQRLFEGGFITYMRTDSPNLSDESITEIQGFVTAEFGDEYFKARKFPAKESAQEAHEAIRPTHLEDRVCGSTDDEKKLYALIYARAIASQMAAARFDEITLTISAGDKDTYLAKARTLTFPGFQAIYEEATSEDDNKDDDDAGSAGGKSQLIAGVKVGESLDAQLLSAEQKYSAPKSRYDEATLVKALEDQGIGRPSTYASILTNITVRGYIETATREPVKKQVKIIQLQHQSKIIESAREQKVGGDKKKLVPTVIGTRIVEFLEEHFATMMDYEFTAEIETRLDDILGGNQRYEDVMERFDQVHQQQLQKVAGLASAARPASSTRVVGEKDGEPVRVGTNQHGTYIVWKKAFYNTTVAADDVTMDDVESAIAAKSEGAAKGLIAKVGKYEIRSGQYGLFVTDGTTKASLKNKTEDEARAMSAADCKVAIDSYKDWLKRKNAKK